MTNREAIKAIQIEQECVRRNWKENCDRNCGECDLVMDAEETIGAYELAITALEKQEPKTHTHADKIRALNDEELAEFLLNITPYKTYDTDGIPDLWRSMPISDGEDDDTVLSDNYGDILKWLREDDAE